MRALVIIPTYDEAENIEAIIDRIGGAVADVDLLVVDDNSPDGTGQIVERLAGERSNLHVLHRDEKAGLGSAYRAGFAWGAERGFEVQVEIDADGSHDPAALPLLLAAVDDGADLAIGSRYVPGGSIPDWTWHRRALSKWANRYAGAMLRLPVRDSTAGYRAYRTTLLHDIEVASVRADGYCFQVEMTDRAVRSGATVVEIPITFRDRERGHSKMSGNIVVEAMWLVTRWGITRRLRGG